MVFQKGKHYSPKTEFKKGQTSWNKGMPMTEESKNKMSESLKGRTVWNKGKRGLQVAWNKGKTGSMPTPWNKGKKGLQTGWNKGIPMKEESKRKLSEHLKKYYAVNPEERKRLAEIGRRASSNPEVRKKMIESHLGQVAWNKGISPTKETTEKQKRTYQKTLLAHPEIRQRMSEVKKGKKRSEESLRKFRLAMKGHKVSEETRRKMSLAQKGKIFPEEYKRRISETLKKYMSNPEMKRKMSEVFKKNWANPELRKRMIHIGEKASNWRGGISFEPYSPEWTRVLKEIIRERDKYICQVCGKKGRPVHHIDYDKKNCNPNNLITLCVSYHSKTGSGDREKWKIFFQEKHLKKI